MDQEDQTPEINRLLQRLELLSRQQEDFSREIRLIRAELYQLRKPPAAIPEQKPRDLGPASGFTVVPDSIPTPPPAPVVAAPKKPMPPAPGPLAGNQQNAIERLIGENIVNKIGIIITVIGVAIGTKYSIEHNLVTPVTRITIGYIAGIVLLLLGIRLKNNYHNYSAVLVSGSMAMMYFVTYAAFAFYHLLPQSLSFVLMLALTVGTVYAAVRYNAIVIAHIGMVGAYAIPILLGDDSGRIWILFTYISIINAGILALAVLRYWKSLYYAAFLLSWAIFSFSYFFASHPLSHSLAWIFLLVFFCTFYTVFLAYKLIRNEKFGSSDIMMLLSNAFVFYAIGYVLLNDSNRSSQAGAFTLANACVHGLGAFLIYSRKLADRSLFLLVGGLALVFCTIAVPVQLDGNWVTLLWIGEALLLFWIGRRQNDANYENVSIPVFLLALLSLMQDWWVESDRLLVKTPVLNIAFLSNSLFAIACGAMMLVSNNKSASETDLKPARVFDRWVLPVVLLLVVYVGFGNEIGRFWNNRYLLGESGLRLKQDAFRFFDLQKDLCLFIYTMLFLLLLFGLNEKQIKNRRLSMAILLVALATVLAFLTRGLLSLSDLRDDYHLSGVFILRYGGIILLFAMCWLIRYLQKQALPKQAYTTGRDLFIGITLLCVLSSELVNWLVLGGYDDQYKLGLSILWGCYALLLVSLGIWKHKQTLRLLALVLFGITLVKLFFYDIADLGTVSKTIVFVSLGVLLLIISFLYNKYRHQITGAKEEGPGSGVA